MVSETLSVFPVTQLFEQISTIDMYIFLYIQHNTFYVNL